MFRKLKNNNICMVHLPRLLALTIPFIFVMFLHIINNFVAMPEFLMDPVIQIAILFSGASIAVIGLSLGFGMLMILILVIWGIAIYYWAQFSANII